MMRAICVSACVLLAGQTLAGAAVQLSPEVALGPAPAYTAGTPQLNVQIARASSHLLAVWVTDQGLAGALDGSPVALATSGVTPAILGVAAGQTNFLLAYQVRMPDFATPLLALRIGFDGRVLDPAPLVVVPDTRGTWGGGVAYDGSEFVIVTMIKAAGLSSVMHASDLITGRVPDDGAVRTGSRFSPQQNAGLPNWPQIAWADNQFIIGYSIEFFGDTDLAPWGLSSLRLSRGETVTGTLGGASFPDAGGLQSSLAIGGDRVTFAWMDVDGARTTINIAQTDLAGNPVLPPAIVAVPPPLPETSSDGQVAIAWDGGEYLLAFIAPRHNAPGQIRGLRLHADGTPIDQQPFDISPDSSAAANIALIATPEGFSIAYNRADAANAGALRAFIRTLDRLPQPRRRAAGR
jgi:hypothetical protein